MLLRFGIQNHKSIFDYQELTWAASALQDDESFLISVDNESLKSRKILPAIAIYGANAAGKSNMIDGLKYLFAAIRGSYIKWPELGRVPRAVFLGTDNPNENISQYDCDLVLKGVHYHYGFTIDGNGVRAEWLYYFPKSSRRVIFHRDFSLPLDEAVYFGPSLKGMNETLISLSKDRGYLFFSVFGKVEHDFLGSLHKKFAQEVAFVDPSEAVRDESVVSALEMQGLKDDILRFLSAADIGIKDFEIKIEKTDDRVYEMKKELSGFLKKFTGDDFEMPTEREEKRVVFKHVGVGQKEFDVGLRAESSGTKFLLSMLASTIMTIRLGKVLIIDEITTSLHTELSRQVVSLFTSEETNKNSAQFLFSTHDTNLLSGELLRRDQVWFAEKNIEGMSCIYPLTDFKTRNSENIEKGYLQGRYGAIPYFGDIKRIFH